MGTSLDTTHGLQGKILDIGLAAQYAVMALKLCAPGHQKLLATCRSLGCCSAKFGMGVPGEMTRCVQSAMQASSCHLHVSIATRNVDLH